MRRPRRFIEIGSGNSTKFARRAIRDHWLNTSIVSIDPFPRSEIDAICDEVVRRWSWFLGNSSTKLGLTTFYFLMEAIEPSKPPMRLYSLQKLFQT